MANFGITYADQTVKDWEALRRAIRLGKLKAIKPAVPTTSLTKAMRRKTK
jgi:hypothetical protein